MILSVEHYNKLKVTKAQVSKFFTDKVISKSIYGSAAWHYGEPLSVKKALEVWFYII